MYVYVPLLACHDPVEANKRGMMNGYDTLPRNAQLVVNAASTATQQLDIIAYAYEHIRHEQGKLKKF